MPNYIKCLSNLTPNDMINARYYDAKKISLDIWHSPNYWFPDVFHLTMFNCLKSLDPNKKYEYDYLKNYFFKAFRLNMIRHYGYSYNRFKSGIEYEKLLIPVKTDFDNRIDGHQMLELVRDKYGEESRNMLWDQLQGFTYNDIDKKYNVNSFYELGKIKKDLKNYYINKEYAH